MKSEPGPPLALGTVSAARRSATVWYCRVVPGPATVWKAWWRDPQLTSVQMFQWRIDSPDWLSTAAIVSSACLSPTAAAGSWSPQSRGFREDALVPRGGRVRAGKWPNSIEKS